MRLSSLLVSGASAFVWAQCDPALAQISSDQLPASEHRAQFDQPGQFNVRTSYDEWVDQKRERNIPVKLYEPDVEGG